MRGYKGAVRKLRGAHRQKHSHMVQQRKHIKPRRNDLSQSRRQAAMPTILAQSSVESHYDSSQNDPFYRRCSARTHKAPNVVERTAVIHGAAEDGNIRSVPRHPTRLFPPEPQCAA